MFFKKQIISNQNGFLFVRYVQNQAVRYVLCVTGEQKQETSILHTTNCHVHHQLQIQQTPQFINSFKLFWQQAAGIQLACLVSPMNIDMAHATSNCNISLVANAQSPGHEVAFWKMQVHYGNYPGDWHNKTGPSTPVS